MLVGVLLIGFALTDGFDMGSMALMPLLVKLITNAVLLLIRSHPTGMVIRSGLSLLVARYLQLGQWYTRSHFPECIGPCACAICPVLRPVGFDYRSKLEKYPMAQLLGLGTLYWWCRTSTCFGVAFGNLFLGIPFSLDSTLRSEYSGSFFSFLTHLL